MNTFKLVEKNARTVTETPDGLFLIDSTDSEQFLKSYNRFVYEDNDPGILSFLRSRVTKLYSDAFSTSLRLITRVFSLLFFPAPRILEYGTILDVGCSTGLFLKHLDWRWKKFGIEVNQRACEIATSFGLTVFNSTFEKFCSDQQFDIIRACHVIEHMKDPWVFFELARKLLKQNGMLIIYTPNSGSLSRLLTRKYWGGWYDETHFTIYNLETIFHAARQYDFTPFYTSTYYMGFLCDALIRLLHIKRCEKICFALFFVFFFPLGLIERILLKADALVVGFKKV